MKSRGIASDDVLVLILGGGRGTRLDPLTKLRSKPAVPLAGKYRLIDVPISNAINSGMRRIHVLTQYNSHSLHSHIARTYRFDPFSSGYVQILAAQQTPGDDTWFQGTADAVRQYIEIVKESGCELVLILSGDHMYRMDYRTMVREHREAGAAVTVGVLPCTEEEIAGFGAVRIDTKGRVREFREKPKDAKARAGMEVDPGLLEKYGVQASKPYLASMGIYLFDTGKLIEYLDNDLTDFGGDIMPICVQRERVQAAFFTGYWRDIGTIPAFFETHMDLVEPNPPFSFYDPSWPFFTRPRYLPGSRVHGATVEDSIVTEGALITDARIRRSVVGLRAVIRSAQIENALVMGADYYDDGRLGGNAPPVGIGEGAVIKNAIIDKNARIGRFVQIINAEGRDEVEGEGWAIRGGITVVAKNAVIPDGTVI